MGRLGVEGAKLADDFSNLIAIHAILLIAIEFPGKSSQNNLEVSDTGEQCRPQLGSRPPGAVLDATTYSLALDRIARRHVTFPFYISCFFKH